MNDWIPAVLVNWLRDGHRVRWAHAPDDLTEGDLCFLLGCGQRVTSQQLARHQHNLVVHESDLPQGRGWSPLTWQVLEGSEHVPVTLLEAVDEIDAGPVYLQKWIELEGHELIDELRKKQATATLCLCHHFVEGYPAIVDKAQLQQGEPTWYPRRTRKDSELDPKRPLAEQFNLLRVVDNERYPAFFSWQGHQYYLSLNKG